jgi:hypothetical protein
MTTPGACISLLGHLYVTGDISYSLEYRLGAAGRNIITRRKSSDNLRKLTGTVLVQALKSIQRSKWLAALRGVSICGQISLLGRSCMESWSIIKKRKEHPRE